ncbi:MAG TPA: hypothetical protein VFH93_14745 [Thermoleophilia bacterium]|nr:hypothetical protein [Thermoleophilia bacterium]
MTMVEELWAAYQEALASVRAGLTDPTTRLGDRAKALDVLGSKHALLSGGVTNRTEVIGGAGGQDMDAWWTATLGSPLTEAEFQVVEAAIADTLAHVLQDLRARRERQLGDGR